MIRPFLIALGVVSLVFGYQEIGLAIDCPHQPEQTGKDWEGEVNAAMARIGSVSGGEVRTKAKIVTQDLLGQLPDAGKIYLEQMKYATICSSVRDDKTLTESEKRKQMREYDLEYQKARERLSSGAKPPASASLPSKQLGKEKGSGTRSGSNPPVMPPTPPEVKQPEAETRGLTGKDLIHEALFTLNCMEQKGEVRKEKLGTTGRYWGEDFENQSIIFRNP